MTRRSPTFKSLIKQLVSAPLPDARDYVLTDSADCRACIRDWEAFRDKSNSLVNDIVRYHSYRSWPGGTISAKSATARREMPDIGRGLVRSTTPIRAMVPARQTEYFRDHRNLSGSQITKRALVGIRAKGDGSRVEKSGEDVLFVRARA